MCDHLGPGQWCACRAAEADLWEAIAAPLRALCRSHDHEDDVQETLLSLLAVKREEVEELLRLRWTILQRRRADRRRAEARRRWELKERLDRMPEASDGENSSYLVEELLRERELVDRLGALSLELLLLIARDEVRGSSRIARRLQQTERAVRDRRTRVRDFLRDYLESLEGPDE